MELRRAPATGEFWAAMNAAANQAFPVGLAFLLARMLPTGDFGRFVFLNSTILTVSGVASVAVGLTASRHVALWSESDAGRASRAATLALVTGAIGSAVVMVLAAIWSEWISWAFLGGGGYGVEVAIAGAAAAAGIYNGVQSGVLAGYQRYRAMAVGGICRLVCAGLLAIPAQAGFGLTGGICSVLGANLAGVAIAEWQLTSMKGRGRVWRGMMGSLQEWRVLVDFSLPALLSAVLVAPVQWYCQRLLLLHDDGLRQVAIFSISLHWRGAVTFIALALSQATVPMLASRLGERGRGGVSRVLARHFVVGVGSSLLVGATLALFGDEVLGLYGRQYSGGAPILAIAAVTGVVMSANTVIGSALTGMGKMWTGFVFNGLWAAVLLALAQREGRSGGAYAMALSVLYAYVAHSVWQGLYIAGQIRGRGQAPSGPAEAVGKA